MHNFIDPLTIEIPNRPSTRRGKLLREAVEELHERIRYNQIGVELRQYFVGDLTGDFAEKIGSGYTLAQSLLSNRKKGATDWRKESIVFFSSFAHDVYGISRNSLMTYLINKLSDEENEGILAAIATNFEASFQELICVQPENMNITSDYKVSIFLGNCLDASFCSNYEKYREIHFCPYNNERSAIIFEGYIFALCSHSNCLNWLGQAKTLAEAELAEHFAQQFLLELGYYPEDVEIEDDSETDDDEHRSKSSLSQGM